MNRQPLLCTWPLLLIASACVDASAPAGVSSDAGVQVADCFPDLSGLPARGGPSDVAEDEGLEPGPDSSPGLDAILAVSDPAAATDGVAPTNNFRRLTHLEYDRSVADLLAIDVGQPSRDFPEELPTLDGYFALGSLRMTDRLISAVQSSAEALAAQFIADGSAFESVVGCSVEAADCKDAFISGLGLRAYRRPLTELEFERYDALFEQGAASNTSDSEFRDGVQIVVEALLQSPHFLYRIEMGSGESDALGELLTGYEAATRLSFMLWGSIPDQPLLEAAAVGELSTPAGIAAQAQRLVDDPRVAVRVMDYHSRWLQLESLVASTKDTELFPEFSPALVASMRGETQRFIEQATLVENGALSALLTAPYGFVDGELAAVYGLEGSFDTSLQRVDFAADSPRAGLLTQAAFLSGHSSSSIATSPILRGIFLLRRLLCDTTIPDPPPNAQMMFPEESEEPLVTTRDFVEWQTGPAECQVCHSIINPVGFAFEEFDAIGRYRTEENGAAVDPVGQVALQATTLEFDNVKALASQIAARPEAQACYARNWVRYLWGRGDTSEDLRTLATITEGLGTAEYGIRDLLLEVTRSAAFARLTSTGVSD